VKVHQAFVKPLGSRREEREGGEREGGEREWEEREREMGEGGRMIKVRNNA
jgi:hypothetical protein